MSALNRRIKAVLKGAQEAQCSRVAARLEELVREKQAEAWDEGQKSGLETGLQIAENVHENGGFLDMGFLPKPDGNPYGSVND